MHDPCRDQLVVSSVGSEHTHEAVEKLQIQLDESEQKLRTQTLDHQAHVDTLQRELQKADERLLEASEQLQEARASSALCEQNTADSSSGLASEQLRELQAQLDAAHAAAAAAEEAAEHLQERAEVAEGQLAEMRSKLKETEGKLMTRVEAGSHSGLQQKLTKAENEVKESMILVTKSKGVERDLRQQVCEDDKGGGGKRLPKWL